jgi:hypothetical protein
VYCIDRELDTMRLEHARERLRRKQLEAEIHTLLLYKDDGSIKKSENSTGWAVRAIKD